MSQMVKNHLHWGNLGLISSLGRFPGGGDGNLLQYSCLENPPWQESPATAHGVAESQTLSNEAHVIIRSCF